MKTIVVFIGLFFVLYPLYSQQFGNEWINYSQHYYKFYFTQNGICRLTSSELASSGIPIGSFNPQNVQVFFRGNEIPVFIKGEDMGLLEYIEFYVQPNDSWLDTTFYDTPQSVLNPYLSQINDTSAYFFTWNNQFTNLRYQPENDVNFTGYTPLPFIFSYSLSVYTGLFFSKTDDCEYTKGEGWFDASWLSLGASLSKTISTPNAYTASADNQIWLSLASQTNYSHHFIIRINNYQLADTVFYGYSGIKGFYNIPAGILQNQNQVQFSSINDQNGLTEKASVGFIRIRYCMNPGANGKNSLIFEIPASSQKSMVELSQFTSSGTPEVFDLSRNKIIKAVNTSQGIKFLVPASEQNVRCIAISPDAVVKPHRIKLCSFVNPMLSQSDYVIIFHPQLNESAQAYKNFRQAVLADINQLYDQFAYGVDKHPVAIRNFIAFALEHWNRKPKYLLMAGKGISSHETKYSTPAWQQCLIPSMGNPPSDNLITTRITNPKPAPAVATGRIAAQTNSELMIYLDKAIAFQQQTPGVWMKNIIHFAGGADASEQATFAAYLQGFENTIEDTLFGGYVSTFKKNSSSPIQITATDSVKNLINGGVSLMTFFGHAASTVGFDQNIDEPSSYSNLGKYPLILANSCYAGNIHQPAGNTISEKWILIANKGAIGFLASVHQGSPALLNIVSGNFYRQLAVYSYGEGIGEIFRKTANYVFNQYPVNTGIKSTIHEFTLHGDPAIILNQLPQPDITFLNGSVWTEPRELTTQADSFKLKIVVTNIGKSVTRPFAIRITRNFSDGSSETLTKTLSKLLYNDTISLTLGINHVKGMGLNQLSVLADENNFVPEFSEANNQLQFSFFIHSSDVIPVYPPDNAIVPNPQITLKASTGDALVNSVQTRFEIDTTFQFTNPVFNIITHNGGVVNWKPPFNLTPGRTYYWRVSKNTVPYSWKTFSFTYLPGQTGWAQSHYYQFVNNPTQFIVLNPSTRKYDFIITPKQLSCLDIGTPTINDLYTVGFLIDGSGDYGVCGAINSVLVTVIDSATLQPWLSDRGNYGHHNYPKCSSRLHPDKYFMFITDSVSHLLKLSNFINDSIPQGFYILVWSIYNPNVANWPESTIQTFESIGAANIRMVPANHPFIFYTRLGYPSQSSLVIGQSPTDEIHLNVTLRTRFSYGTVKSTLIGPSTGWDYMEWSASPREQNSNETILLSISGVTASGNIQSIADSIPVTNDSISMSHISPLTYPFLQLSLFSRDEEYLTPALLNNWKVIYTPSPEFAVNPRRKFQFNSDTISEGDQVSCYLAIENLTDIPADSITMKYWLTNSENNEILLSQKNIKAPLPQLYTTDSIYFSTLGKKGNHHFWVEANALNPISGQYLSPEMLHSNNFINKPFYIMPDKINPLLDVTFDGLHITNGEIVSAQPEIVIQLTDENKYLALNDTSLFAIYLTYPLTHNELRINFDQMEWIPAVLPKNSCKIIFRPQFDTDGEYQLKVQARDASNNQSGRNDYKVSFRIINKASISEVFNYPNPFSTSTRFVFTLTGSQIPDDFKIQIMTLSGKLVKTITRDELGTIRIGRNISTNAWDGTDDFGDKLANGVYFYRVICTMNGKEPEKNSNHLEKYFREGFGKLYIMR